MAEPFGDQLNPGTGKRPAPTIEGTATEVSIDAAPGETGSPDPAVEAETSDPEGPEPKHGPKKPPPRTSPTELKGFFTHLAAGLLGGLIGVVALALFWNKLPARNAAAPDLTTIEGRLAKLEIGTSAGRGHCGAWRTRCPRQDPGRPQGRNASRPLRSDLSRDTPRGVDQCLGRDGQGRRLSAGRGRARRKDRRS